MVGSNPHHSIYKEKVMTIKELIDKVKEEKPNSFTNVKLLEFVNEVEENVAEELRDDEFEPYTAVDDTELLVQAPYDDLYVYYLKAQIDYSNEEYPSYQLNAEQYNACFDSFADWVVRTGQVTYRDIPSRFRNIF